MGFVRRHPVVTAVLAAALVVTGAVTLSAVAVWRAAHHDEARHVDRADAVVVLGAAEYNGRPSPVFQARLDHAAIMYRRGFTREVIVAGGKRPGDQTTEAEAGRDYLVSQGLPDTDVDSVSIGNTTWESLRGVADFMRGNGLRSAFLVSDPWHNLRIRRMGRDLGIEAYVSATGASAVRPSEMRRSVSFSRDEGMVATEPSCGRPRTSCRPARG